MLGQQTGAIMNITNDIARFSRNAVFVLLATVPAVAYADSGVYIGASFGNATLDTGIEIPDFVGDFDEDDSAYKVLLGYRFDLPSVFVAVEGGYVDLGQPKLTVATETLEIDPTGVHLSAIAGVEAGPAELYLKAGYIAWDADLTFTDDLGNSATLTEDGSDMGYGLGIAFGVGPVTVRGEFEKYDIEDADASMLSVGFTYLFD
jgi:hypothetical protein